MSSLSAPRLHIGTARSPVTLAVLVLHGGKVASHSPSRPWHLSALRMWPFTWSLRRTGAASGIAVHQLEYRYRGWNGVEQSPVDDARWALSEIRQLHGDVPIVVIGHSLGGRTAAAIADDSSVVGILGLAPWWPEGNETSTMRDDQTLLVVHGTADRWTSAALSEQATNAAALRGIRATWIPVPRAGHFMLRRPWFWDRTVTDFVASFGNAAQSPRDSDRCASAPERRQK